MKKLLLALLGVVSLSGPALGQVSWHWARALQQVTINSMATDAASGDTYLTGSFATPLSFTSSYFSGPKTLTPVGKVDVFIACVDVNRSLRWVRQVGGTGAQAEGSDIALDGQGGLYVVGSFNDTLTTNVGTPALSADLVYTSGLILRCSAADGTTYWSHAVGNQAYNSVCRTVAAGPGSVYYVGGHLGGGTINLGTKTVEAKRRSAFIAAYSGAALTPTWVDLGDLNLLAGQKNQPFDGSLVAKLAVDAVGNCYATGWYDCGLKLAGLSLPNNQLFTLQTFVVRLNPATGAAIWLKGHAGASTSDNARGTGLTVYGRYCYVGGIFSGTEDFGSGIVNTTVAANAAYVARYDVGSGATLWVRNLGSALLGGVRVAGDDQYVVAALSIDAAPDYARLLALTPTGTTLWSQSVGGSGSSSAAVALAGTNAVVWAGGFQGSCLFGPNTLTAPTGKTLGFVGRLLLTAPKSGFLPNSSLQLYPNPADSEVQLKWPARLGGSALLSVYDAQGNCVVQRPQAAAAALDVRGWRPGPYVVRLLGNGFQETQLLQIR